MRTSVCVCTRVHFQSLPTLQTPQAPLFWGFPRQEYWSGSPFPPPEDLPESGFEPISPSLTGGFFPTEPPGKPLSAYHVQSIGIISVDSALEQNCSLYTPLQYSAWKIPMDGGAW